MSSKRARRLLAMAGGGGSKKQAAHCHPFGVHAIRAYPIQGWRKACWRMKKQSRQREHHAPHCHIGPTPSPHHLLQHPRCSTSRPPAWAAAATPLRWAMCCRTGTLTARLVQPEQDWTHWDDSAAALHRITRELLHERGLRAREVATAASTTQLAGQTVYSDGWANDFTWLNRALYRSSRACPPASSWKTCAACSATKRPTNGTCRQSPDRQRARHPAAQGEFGCALDPAHPATYAAARVESPDAFWGKLLHGRAAAQAQ